MVNKDFNFEPVCQVSVKNVIHNVKYVLDNFNVEKGVYSLVNLGYVDGLDRNYKPKRCMDLSFEKGKGKIVIDNLLKLCKINNTIPYEILANISPRIKREYVDIYESDWW